MVEVQNFVNIIVQRFVGRRYYSLSIIFDELFGVERSVEKVEAKSFIALVGITACRFLITKTSVATGYHISIV